MSRVFRFHSPPAFAPKGNLTILRKRPSRDIPKAVAIAADLNSITDADGTRPLDEYISPSVGQCVTLTRREADLVAVANPGVRPPVALEDLHPWLPAVEFLNDSKASFRKIVQVVDRWGLHFLNAAQFCDTKWATICNAIRTKNDLDTRFYAAWHAPIQDAFVLEERRPGRSVIAIDFNAMYPACMQETFPDPGAFRHVHYGRDLESNEAVPVGLYRCVLHGPASELIARYNPFRSFFLGRHLRAALSDAIEVDLNEFEVVFFRRHFQKVYVIDAVISDRCIAHPLAREVRRASARRKHFRAQGNKTLADREKYLSTLMSACSQRPRRSRLTFKSRREAEEYLRLNYGIASTMGEPSAASEFWKRGRKGITMTETMNGVLVDAPDLFDGSACFMLNQRTVARSRIVLLGMMEKILAAAPGIEICYANIDSVHFSVGDADLPGLLRSLRAESSDEMGSFKIEAVTRHGLWLEPGRYWLFDKTVEKFRNRGVGNRRDPFRDHAMVVSSRAIGGLSIPIRSTVRMERTMADSRKLIEECDEGLIRQKMVEIGANTTFEQVLAQLEENRKQSVPRQMLAFRQLQTHVGSSRPAASGRDRLAKVM